MFQNSNFALINAISVTVIMDQINGWPKQLLCLCAMTGSCREQFGHFVLMSEVSSAVVSCKLPIITPSLYPFLFPLLAPSLLCSLHTFFSTFKRSFAIAALHVGQPSIGVTLSLGTTVFLTQI